MSAVDDFQSAIRQAVHEQGQPERLARVLGAWVDDVLSGNETLDDGEAAMRRLDALFECIVVNLEDD